MDIYLSSGLAGLNKYFPLWYHFTQCKYKRVVLIKCSLPTKTFILVDTSGSTRNVTSTSGREKQRSVIRLRIINFDSPPKLNASFLFNSFIYSSIFCSQPFTTTQNFGPTKTSSIFQEGGRDLTIKRPSCRPTGIFPSPKSVSWWKWADRSDPLSWTRTPVPCTLSSQTIATGAHL